MFCPTDLSYPAHLAAYSGDLEHLESLIEKGVSNINEQDEKGSTAAHKGNYNFLLFTETKTNRELPETITSSAESSRKHVCDMNTPLNPTFIKQNWGLQGYTYFFFLPQNISCGYSLEQPRVGSFQNVGHFVIQAELEISKCT